jgi:hypothetical protein
MFAPSFKSTFQRPHPFHSMFLQFQRRPGAGGFVGSSTVENHISVERYFSEPQFKFLEGHMQSTRQFRGALEVQFQGTPKI